MRILLILLISVLLDAKVVEVKQLFNKTTVKVKKEDFSVSKDFYGDTRIDEGSIRDIVLRYDGFINYLYANREYQAVKKSQKLFNIYSKEIVNIQEELIVSKKINTTLTSALKTRLRRLDIDNSIISKISNRAIENINILSPIDGVVIKKNINSGSFVKKGKLLLQIANFSQLWVIAKVYQRDISFIKKGMSADIKIDGFETIKSKVDFIYPTLNQKTKTIDIRLIIDNRDYKIYPNLFAKVRFKKASKSILTLPRSAVLTKANKHYIFKPINDREFEPVEVVAIRLNSYKFEIKSGLKEGDEVIDRVMFMLDSEATTNGLYDDDEDW